MLTYYDVVGVSVDATSDEIRQAYHRKAQLLHPDRHIGASSAILQESEESMALLNKAWETLSSPERRQAYDRTLTVTPTTQPAFRLPGLDECVLCGSVPATSASLRQETGKLLWRTRRRLEDPSVVIAALACLTS
jgi:curved DNA-binding protein CbpA